MDKAWRAAVLWVARSQTWLSNQRTTTNGKSEESWPKCPGRVTDPKLKPKLNLKGLFKVGKPRKHSIFIIILKMELVSNGMHSVSFPDSSAGKESACNAGDPGSIPGSGRSPGGGIGYPLQSSWASLVAQLVKNLPAMWETWVGSLGWEDPLEKGKATHSSILAWRIPWTL